MFLEQPLAFRIKSLNNQIKRLFHQTALASNSDGLTGMQFGILGYIGERSRQGAVYQRDIEAEFNIRRPTATGILQLLEKGGYIRRETAPGDARLKCIILLDKAVELEKIVKAQILRMQDTLTQGITEEELAGFYAVLDKIAENANR